MPTAEWVSVTKTFSMSRWAMILPIVARRSPAITTPFWQVTATIVVPCGTVMGAAGDNAAAPCPGSRWGSAAVRNSVNDPLPGRMYAAGMADTGQRPT